ncbi:helix-turn-helix transcriptional regulator [Natrinema amylolyticum]|uniref:helix-turn-helix transcriptional regulator n=1 Tax=Natrinema amylolyticum TaxID=2878679 RepID=UPI001CFA9BDF|nr:hypothetical protein [Natrinema amylolyticum]
MTTDTGLDTDEALDTILRRASVIECLIDGPKYNRDIRDELDISRSTAYKAVSELEEQDIARRCDEGYELTVLGQLLFDQYRQFHGRVEDICRPGRLLAVLPRGTEIPFVFLDGAAVSISKKHAPNQPVHEIERVIDEASTVKGTGPVVLPSYVELFSDQIVSGELEAELVFERPVFDHLRTNYEEDFSAAFESDNLSVWVTDAELPFALLVIESPSQKAAIIIYDSSGDIKGAILNDTEQAYTWGGKQWERYRNSGVTPPTETDE